MLITKRNVCLFLWLFIFIFVVYTLIHISYQVQTLTKKLETINSKISAEKDSIHTLNAEWAYLTNPKRIERLSMTLLPDLHYGGDQYLALSTKPNHKRGQTRLLTLLQKREPADKM